MGKANISFPAGMLEEVDRRADAAGTSRSGFVQEAVAHYLEELDQAAAQAERQRQITEARQRMAELGTRLPAGHTGATLVRQMRDAAPVWLKPARRRRDE